MTLGPIPTGFVLETRSIWVEFKSHKNVTVMDLFF